MRLEAEMNTGGWHVPEEDLRAYARGALTPPWLWSADAHLAACPGCRDRLAAAVDPAVVPAGWSRLDAELDAPRPGLLERAFVRSGVPAHTARLLAATPVLRRSWLASVTLTLIITTASTHLAQTTRLPILLLTIAPVLPLIGVAVSFGPRVDPTYELAMVAPMHMFRLLLLRCAAVLATTTLLSAVASLALPGYGLAVLGWLVPSLVLTLLSLALTPRLGPVTAAMVAGLGWAVLMTSTVQFGTGESIVFTPAGQGVSAMCAVAAAGALRKARPGFEIGRHLSRPYGFANRPHGRGMRRIP